MGKLLVSVKRFLGNKNTVTILGVIAGIVVLYVGYNWRVNQAVEPVQVPYAKVEIPSNTLITKDMIGTVKVSRSMVDQTPTLIRNMNEVVQKYSNYDTTIPEGSLIYKSQVINEEQKPDYITENIEKCHTLFSLKVDLHDTYGNAIMPNDYIDLFMLANSDDGRVIVAKLIEHIKVRDVRDSKGISVFSSKSTGKDPAELLFSVPNDMFLLLTRANHIKSNSIKLFPVPRNKEYTDNSSNVATQVTGQQIVDFIDSKSDLSYSDSLSLIDQECLNQTN